MHYSENMHLIPVSGFVIATIFVFTCINQLFYCKTVHHNYLAGCNLLCCQLHSLRNIPIVIAQCFFHSHLKILPLRCHRLRTFWATCHKSYFILKVKILQTNDILKMKKQQFMFLFDCVFGNNIEEPHASDAWSCLD